MGENFCQNRYRDLKNRLEKLIHLNNRFHFTQSGNPKIDQYYRCLLAVKKQLIIEKHSKIKPDKNASSNVRQGFLNPHYNITVKDFYVFTNQKN